MPSSYHLDALLKALGLIALYVLLARLTVFIATVRTAVGFLWLASGVALAVVLLNGYRYLPAILLGALLGNLLSGLPFSFSLVSALSHTAGIWLGVWLTTQEGRFDPAVRTSGDYLRIFVLASFTGLFTATLMQMAMAIAPPSFNTEYGTYTFNQRWAGNTLGISIVMPLVLVWRRPPREWMAPGVAVEAALILGLSFLVGQVIFLDWLHDSFGQIARGYWMYLFITWAAVRLGPHGTVLLLALTAIQAIVGAEIGTGFFADDIAKTQLANYFFYMLCLSTAGLALATYFTEVKSERQQIQDLNLNLEARVRQRTEELSRANRELEAFSYSVSHDLRAPLRALDGYAHLIRDDEAKHLSPDGRYMLERIWINAAKMGVLIDDILRFSRVGRSEMQRADVDMTALARSVAGQLCPDYARAELAIDELPHVRGDEAMLRQVWVNLIGNALKFSAKADQPHVMVGTTGVAGETAFFVRDNGAGFDMAQAGKLFEVFRRLHSDKDFPGTGAGLAIVKRIIERHGGKIWAEAQPDRGATLYFTLGTETRS